MTEALERAHLEAKAERVSEREKILEGALKAATTKYLASDSFKIVRADCL